MKNKLRRVAIVVLALIFVGSLGMVIHREIEYKQGEETYEEAAELVQLPDLSDLPEPAPEETEEPTPVYVDPYADALRNMDFTALREVNSDVLGWILIPNTVLSYPLVQGDNNQYYLTHTWKKWTSAVGSIFMEYRNSPDFSDFNTVIYGHRMNNGSMFASLKYYKKQSYWAAHPYVYITDDRGSHRYEIFAAYEVSTEGKTYQIGFSSDASKQAFIDYCLEQSVIDTGITPTVYDQILTLSTCTGNGHATRWVVQAVLKGVAPSNAAEQAPVQTPPAQTEPAVPEQPAQTPEEAPAETPNQEQDPDGVETQPEAGQTPESGTAPENSEQEQPEGDETPSQAPESTGEAAAAEETSTQETAEAGEEPSASKELPSAEAERVQPQEDTET